MSTVRSRSSKRRTATGGQRRVQAASRLQVASAEGTEKVVGKLLEDIAPEGIVEGSLLEEIGLDQVAEGILQAGNLKVAAS